MRPLTLRVNGLRSYRSEQLIDFADKDLIAIVGDTGAGKSSILEAICFALYGSSTWHAASAAPLIADGGDGTLRVELTFRANGRTWRVTRTISRGYQPPSVHRLVCLDDDTDINGADPVSAKIRMLVGLDYKTFLKAVILPQGRFQALLQTPEAERTSILKNILGLDEITAVRERALALRDRLQPLLADLKEQRATMPADPKAVIDEATGRLQTAETRLKQLRTAKSTIEAAVADGGRYTARAAECRKTGGALAAMVPADIEARYQSLVDKDAVFEAELGVLEGQLGELARNKRGLQNLLAAADSEGSGVAAVAAAINVLDTLAALLPVVDEQRRRVEDEQVAIAADRDALDSQHRTLAELSEAAATAKTEAAAAETLAEAADEKIRASRALLETARVAVAEEAKAVEAERSARELVSERKTAVAVAEGEEAAAEAAVAAAEQVLEALHRANSAAHAASASHPGDPCPVCARELPDGFTAPAVEVEGTEQAAAACAGAKERAKARTSKAAAARAELQAAVTGLGQARQDVARTTAEHQEAIAAVREMLGAIDLAWDDDTILADLLVVARESRDAYGEAQKRADDTHDKVTTATAALQAARLTLDARERALGAAERNLERRAADVAEKAAQIPELYRVDGEPTIDAINAKREEAQRRKKELEDVERRLDDIQKRMDTVRADQKDLERRHRTDVERPADELRREIQRLADRSRTAAELLDAHAPPQPQLQQTGAGLADEAAWAGAVVATTGEIVERLRREAITEEVRATTAREIAARALAACGLTTDDELDQTLLAVGVDAHVAQRDIEEARSQQPLAAELDRRIGVGRPTVAGLDELGRLLADGKFMAAVVKRRQRALLGTATSRLLSMTERRFAFSEDFRIIDGQTGQPRDVKTLSGGETFLASLALALAVVELTARAGGHVEALFLDEGFGTLDADALADALDTLSQRASGGRLVAIISHMRAVAENLEHVLVVERTPGGSHAHWASTAERDQIVTNELTSGLLV